MSTRKDFLLSLFSLTGAIFAAPSLALAGSKKDKFSAQQQKELLKIQETTEIKIFEILTPEQKAIQKEAIKQGNQRPDVKLSDAQKAEIKKIRADAQQQTNAVLGLQ
jgi:Spy/CpxP family protein refolding chaperone